MVHGQFVYEPNPDHRIVLTGPLHDGSWEAEVSNDGAVVLLYRPTFDEAHNDAHALVD